MVLRDVAKEIFPPGVPAILRWRLAMFAVVMLMLFHIAWACGWLAYAGLGDGFAHAAEVNKVQGDISTLRESILEQQLFDMHIKRCASPDGSEIRTYLAEKIQTKQKEYRRITGAIYDLPGCDQL